jgi:hypothetical protein
VASHRLAEERSLAYHRVIAEALARDPAILVRARERVAQWELGAPMSPAYVRAWRAALEGPPAALAALLVDPSEHGRAMRQTTPFAGALTARDRWRIFRSVGTAGP